MTPSIIDDHVAIAAAARERSNTFDWWVPRAGCRFCAGKGWTVAGFNRDAGDAAQAIRWTTCEGCLNPSGLGMPVG